MALNPATLIDEIPVELFALLDLVLVMTVEPGFGGQELLPECLAKIHILSEIRSSHKCNFQIQVDGGVKAENIHMCVGADVIVAGSAIYSLTRKNRQNCVLTAVMDLSRQIN